jgi:hypothetical protein
VTGGGVAYADKAPHGLGWTRGVMGIAICRLGCHFVKGGD